MDNNVHNLSNCLLGMKTIHMIRHTKAQYFIHKEELISDVGQVNPSSQAGQSFQESCTDLDPYLLNIESITLELARVYSSKRNTVQWVHCVFDFIDSSRPKQKCSKSSKIL